ncbi:MAG TPA: hypothetical protein VJ750_12430 [Rhizomicrobium sp.]|nr:hypothetical protein [Rhizomicrobium sp.]
MENKLGPMRDPVCGMTVDPSTARAFGILLSPVIANALRLRLVRL